MFSTLTQLLDTGSFLPHGHCFLWKPLLLWGYVIFDAVIAASYYSIPFALWYFAQKRSDLPFRWVFVMFGVFVMACGTTHVLAVWNIWEPHYWADAGIKGITAIASIFTAAALWPLIPRALAVPSSAQLARANVDLRTEIAKRGEVEDQLKRLNESLESRVAERTAELEAANRELQREVAERKAMEEGLRELSHAVEQSPAATTITDTEGRIEYINPKFTEVTGYTAAEVIGKTPAVIKSGLTPAEVYEDLWRTIKSGHEWRGEMQNRKKNGELYWEYEIISPLKNERGEIVNFIAVKEDITPRKRAEAELIRVNRTLHMLSECNLTLIHASDEAELFNSICRNIVEIGGYRLAWIGYAEDRPEKTVRMAAHAGELEAHLRALVGNIFWDDSADGMSVTGTAIRTRKITIANDVQTNPRYAHWHDWLSGAGIVAVTSLPLMVDDRVMGALSIYSRDTDAFGTDEVTLLSELADDLAFGIAWLRTAAERQRAEEEVRNLLIEQESILENTIAGIAFLRERRIVRCNRGFAAMFGYERDELIGMSTRQFHTSDDAYETYGREAYPMVEKGGHFTADTRYRRKDGSVFWVNTSLTAVDRNDLAKGVIWVMQDITERKRAEEGLRLRDRAIESSVNGIMISDSSLPDKPVIYVNPAFERITGYTAQEAVGRNSRFLVRDDMDQMGLVEVRAALREGRPASTVVRSYRKDGSIFWNELSVAPVRNASGQVTHFVSIINDVTERMRYEEELERQANYDTLTGLANRNLLADRLDQAIASAQRYERVVAVVFLDLDHFKVVNDSLGHGAGDLLVKRVAQRLSGCVRETDTVARAGGDEFVLVFSDAGQGERVATTMQRIQDAIATPFDVEGQELYVTCSMGASVFPRDGRDGRTLLKNADAAMYRAKEDGRNTFRFYTPEMNARMSERLKLERGLRRAVEKAEFVLHYQPQVEFSSGKIVGAEVLLRWQNPELGLVPPLDFIPLAEETGLIVAIGEWVLRTACIQNKQWQDAGLPPVVMAVNLSARQFREPNLAATIKQIVEECGLAPRYLELEITESIVMRSTQDTLATLNELHDLGMKLAIDDFGTGYSSLAYLKRFPVDTLKIDRSFIRDITVDPDDYAIVGAIIAMARSLKIATVAEGVETEQQSKFLGLLRCNAYQGYYFSKAVPAQEFAELLRTAKKVP